MRVVGDIRHASPILHWNIGQTVGCDATAERKEWGQMNQKHLELCSSAEWGEAVQQWIIPRVIDGLELGDDVLEIGPGPGLTTDVLATKVRHLTAIEVDESLANALAERLSGSNVEVTHADATNLPYADGRFSTALSFTMLHHVPSVEAQDRVLAEVTRVLRPGGTFAGTDSPDGEAFRDLHVGDVCVPIEAAGFEARLVQAGFSETNVESDEYGVHFRASVATA
jgi:SAM-dependent methyltransferase